MLNTQSEETNTIFYSYSAWFLNTLTLNMYVSISYARDQRAEYGIRIRVAAPQEYVNTYSTCRVGVPGGDKHLIIIIVVAAREWCVRRWVVVVLRRGGAMGQRTPRDRIYIYLIYVCVCVCVCVCIYIYIDRKIYR